MRPQEVNLSIHLHYGGEYLTYTVGFYAILDNSTQPDYGGIVFGKRKLRDLLNGSTQLLDRAETPQSLLGRAGVRRIGDRVRITAQLADASNGYNLWSGSYERQLNDIFSLQDELARAIVQALRVELGVETSERPIAEQTRSPEAYNWFLRGRALDDWSTQQNTFQSISYFEKAVEIDPEYAMVWGYVAFARAVSLTWQSVSEASLEAISAYERALALNPEQSEALAINAVMKQILEHDWETAGKLYQRAMAFRENANALAAYAFFYLQHIDAGEKAMLGLSLGEVEEAIDLMEHAVENNSLAQLWSRIRFRHNEAVKNHPRYLALLKRIGLDDQSVAKLNCQMSFD